jgi:dTDP-4-amino-4,6-dideoxygalactose transaminase
MKLGTKRGDYPVSEYVAERTLAVPLYSTIKTDDVDQVCESLDQAIEKVLMGRCKGRF